MPKNLDQVILVNENDEPIGTMDKVKAHRGLGKLHRAISVFLFREVKEKKGERPQLQLLIQRRSSKKIVGADHWANTCCGNVRPDESYLGCALRRLKEELGIELNSKKQPLTKHTKFTYQVKCNDQFSENEIDTVFWGWYDDKVDPNPDEVAGYEWVSVAELLQDLDASKFSRTYAPWFLVMHKRGILRDLIKKVRPTTL